MYLARKHCGNQLGRNQQRQRLYAEPCRSTECIGVEYLRTVSVGANGRGAVPSQTSMLIFSSPGCLAATAVLIFVVELGLDGLISSLKVATPTLCGSGRFDVTHTHGSSKTALLARCSYDSR